MLRALPQAGTTINLTFHGVGPKTRVLDAGEERVWVTSQALEAALDASVGRRDVRITFDDGNRSDVTIALPALRERGLTATFFLVAGRLDQPGFLSRENVAQLLAAGMTIGNHGMEHRSWRGLPATELDRELVTARHVLEKLSGTPVVDAAVPFGRYDRSVLSALRRRGYVRAFTSDGGPARADGWLQARTSLQRDDGPAELRTILDPAMTRWALARRDVKTAVKRWR